MKTKYFLFAAIAAVGLASCTNDEFVGDNSPTVVEDNVTGAIGFGSGAGNLTRATSNTGTDAEKLDGQFKIYGVKNVSGYTDVFKNYVLWSTATQTVSNPDGDWEYVGASTQGYGSDGATIGAVQTIKYWDYSASNYHFVAGSPVANFTYALSSGDIATATVTGLAGHISANPTTGGGSAITTNPVYIADPVNVNKSDFNTEVTFNFKRQQSFVRVGVFETIPGYSITEIKFYAYGSSAWESTPDANHNIILASTTANYFSGSSNGTATITYDWSTATPSYTFAYTTSTLTQAKNWYGGALTGVQAITSTESDVAKLYGTDLDMASTGYFTVIPSASSLTAAPILIKCDYTLTADDGNGETINVKGATAAIPAAFTYWKPNTSYTYLFKISNNTNGTTGNPSDDDPEGLFPITFDAVVEAITDAVDGIITSVTTPSITTYQAGSVTDKGISYVKDKVIYFTAQNDETGALYTLTTGGSAVSNVQVYSLGTTAMTEADLQLTAPTTTVSTSITSDATAVGSWSIPAGSGYFTPTADGYYAIQYQTAASPAAYTYKVVKVGE